MVEAAFEGCISAPPGHHHPDSEVNRVHVRTLPNIDPRKGGSLQIHLKTLRMDRIIGSVAHHGKTPSHSRFPEPPHSGLVEPDRT